MSKTRRQRVVSSYICQWQVLVGSEGRRWSKGAYETQSTATVFHKLSIWFVLSMVVVRRPLMLLTMFMLSVYVSLNVSKYVFIFGIVFMQSPAYGSRIVSLNRPLKIMVSFHYDSFCNLLFGLPSFKSI